MKIVYCTDSISRMGGIEIVTIAKANALAAITGNQVWIAVSDYKRPAIMKLTNVQVLDLAVHYFEEDGRGYWHAIIDFWKKQRFHRRRLEQVLNEINPDVVITTGKDTRRFLPKLKIRSNPIFIRELHFSRHYGLQQALGWLKWTIVKIGEIYEYGLLIRKYDKIVVLTEADKSGSWKNWDKVAVIPNPLVKEEKGISHELALKTIEEIVKDAEIYTKGIKVRIEREKIPGLIKKLVNHDYSIYSVYEMQISLEEAFLEKTGGNTID